MSGLRELKYLFPLLLLPLIYSCTGSGSKMYSLSGTVPVPIIRDTIPAIDSASQRILLIGDSMTKGIMHRLNQYCQENGHDMKTVIWVAGNTYWFSRYDTIEYYIHQYKPTYVMLVLGANELWVSSKDPRRYEFIQRVANKLKEVKHIWIGPPNWKQDQGINAMIKQVLGTRRFFESSKLTYERMDDGMHVTRRSAAVWMDSIAEFIQHKSLYPIRLQKPSKISNIEPIPIYLLPLSE